MQYLLALTLLMGPWFLMKAEGKLSFLKWTGTVVNCYVFGLLLGNLAPGASGLSQSLTEACVLLAIPLLLLPTDFLAWLRLARTTVISFALVCFSVSLSALVLGKIFAGLDLELWKVAGMLVGVYTGGVPNLTAIGKALEVKNETFLIVNMVDMFLGGILLLILMTLGLRFLTWWLPAFDHSSVPDEDHSPWHEAQLRWKRLSVFEKFLPAFKGVLLSALVAGFGVALSWLLWRELSPATVILGLSALAIGLSFVKGLRELEGASEVGHYLLLAFCCYVGSLAKFSQLSGAFTGPWMWFTALVLFSAMALHFLLCRLFKIDRDTALVTSVAGIYGPAFIPPFTDLLKNRWLLVSGITTGLVGFAVGNFLGLAVSYLLKP